MWKYLLESTSLESGTISISTQVCQTTKQGFFHWIGALSSGPGVVLEGFTEGTVLEWTPGWMESEVGVFCNDVREEDIPGRGKSVCSILYPDIMKKHVISRWFLNFEDLRKHIISKWFLNYERGKWQKMRLEKRWAGSQHRHCQLLWVCLFSSLLYQQLVGLCLLLAAITSILCIMCIPCVEIVSLLACFH